MASPSKPPALRMSIGKSGLLFDKKQDSTPFSKALKISQQFRCWRKQDAPPKRVHPIPVKLVTFLLNLAYAHGVAPSPAKQALADIICIAFFFLLRSGDYTGTINDKAVFALDNVRVFLGTRLLNLEHLPIQELEAVTSMSLYFTTQKNKRKGDAIAHGHSLHPLCYPLKVTLRLVLRHRRWFQTHQKSYNSKAKLATFYKGARMVCIRVDDVTK